MINEKTERQTMSKRFSVLRQHILAGFLALLPLWSAPCISADIPPEQWQFSLTPYLWAPNVDGKVQYTLPSGTGNSADIAVGADTYLSNLEFAFMFNAEARKERWSIFTDLAYVDFSSERSQVQSVDFGPAGRVGASLDTGTSSSLKGAIWTLVGGYAVVDDPRTTLDVIAGFRYFGARASTDWQLSAAITAPGGAQTFPRSGSISQREDIWDGIIGVRGRVKLGSSNWSVPYYFDAGTGSSTLTWQAVAGIAYAFGWGDIGLVYRHLQYNMKDGKLVEDMRLSGPAIGVAFRF
jgi:hypothetical protein